MKNQKHQVENGTGPKLDNGDTVEDMEMIFRIFIQVIRLDFHCHKSWETTIMFFVLFLVLVG